MNSDIHRERLFSSPDKLFGDMSFGSLPVGPLAVRRDDIVITSATRSENFKIGAPEHTAEIPQAVLELGMQRFQNSTASGKSTTTTKGSFATADSDDKQVPLNTTTVKTAGLMPVTAQSLQNPTNRVL